MSNGARQFPETGDFAPFCANRFCADGLFYFHVELFRCAGESPLRRRPKGMKTNEVCDRPLETFGAATFGVNCGGLMPELKEMKDTCVSNKAH